jgi:hypothetical protein
MPTTWLADGGNSAKAELNLLFSKFSPLRGVGEHFSERKMRQPMLLLTSLEKNILFYQNSNQNLYKQNIL